MTSTTNTATVSSEQQQHAKEPQGVAGTPASPISVTTAASDSEPWKISRWSAIQEKRLKLSQQRVALERRLFETAPQFERPKEPDTLVQDMEVALASKEGASWSGPLDQATKLPQGNGRMVYQNGQVYEGDVVQGNRHGKGCNRWPNGQVFTGIWKNNSRCGRGTHAW